MSSRKKKVKEFFLISTIVLIFIGILSILPSCVRGEETLDYGLEQKRGTDKSSTIIEQTKFQTIADKVKIDLENVKVKDSYNPYIIELLVQNKINNRDNTVAQEILSLYLSNKTNVSKRLTFEYIEPILDHFDAKSDRVWRNHVLLLEYDNKSLPLYNESQLLKPIEKADVIGISSVTVRPYKYQKYYFTLPDRGVELITLNLFTGESDGNISKYIDLATKKPKVDLRAVESEFIESEDEYILKFVVWK